MRRYGHLFLELSAPDDRRDQGARAAHDSAVLTATQVSFYVGFAAGKILAWKRGRALKYVTTLGGVTLYTVFIPWSALMMIWLFAFSLGWFPIGRNSMLETLHEDYIMAARAKGLLEHVIRDKHAARNAMLPVVTAFVFALATALDGGVIAETVFSSPGMGLTLLEAVLVQDIPMIMSALVFIGILAMPAHLAADILYAYLDPRIRYS